MVKNCKLFRQALIISGILLGFSINVSGLDITAEVIDTINYVQISSPDAYMAFIDSISDEKQKLTLMATKQSDSDNVYNISGTAGDGDDQELISWNYAPASPTAASLGVYGQTNVDLYTGRPIINIPIYELKGNKVSLPISLSYNAGGLKVDELAGWVGTNWSLNAGGVIIRNMNGRPDEEATNGYFANASIVSDLSALRSLSNTKFDDGAAGKWDTEPDEFYFNFDGHTGRIVFDKDQKPHIFPYSNYRVSSVIEDNKIKSFMITTDDGTIYSFGKGDNSVEQSQLYVYNFGIEHLHQVGPLKAEDLGNNQYKYINKDSIKYATIDGAYEPWSKFDKKSSIVYNSSWYLTEKRLPSGEKITLTYVSDGWISYRLGISRVDSNVTGMIDFPDKTYYNNDVNCYNILKNGSTSNLWYTSYYYYLLNPYRQMDGADPFNTRIQYTLSLIECDVKHLSKITTDQGYFIEFTADEIREDITNKKLGGDKNHVGGSLKNLTKIEIFDNRGTSIKKFVFDYILKNNIESYLGTNVLVYSDNCGDIYQGSESSRYFLNSFYESSSGVSRPKYTFEYYEGNIPRRCYNNSYLGYFKTDPYAGTLNKIKYPTGGETIYNYEPNYYYDSGLKQYPGIRILSIENKINEKSVGLKEYYYTTTVLAFPIFFNYIQPFQIKNSDDEYISFIRRYASSYNVAQSTSQQIGYCKVIEKELGHGTKEYYYYSTADGYDFQDRIETIMTGNKAYKPVLKYQNRGYKRGLLKRTIGKNENGNKLRITDNTYNFNTGKTIDVQGVLLYKFFRSDKETERSFATYHNYDEWVYPLSSTDSVLDVNKNIWQTAYTSYEYNSDILKIKEVKQIQSDGSVKKVQYKYPQDFSTLPVLNDAGWPINILDVPNDYICNCFYWLKKLNIKQPIEVLSWKNEQLIEGSLTVYNDYNPEPNKMILPYIIYEINSPIPINDFIPTYITSGNNQGNQTFKFDSRYYKPKVIFDNYCSNNGNLLQYHPANDINTSYIWGYNQTKPIAEVKNASANEIYFEGFEDAIYSYSGGHSGKYCTIINSSNQYTGVKDFAKSNLTSGKYVFSGWFKTTGTAVLVVKDFDDGNPWLSTSINNTGGIWKYYELVVDMNDTQFNGCTTVRCEVYSTSTSNVYVDDLRFRPLNSLMSTYTYNPLIGVTSKTDENNRTTYYEYDDLGRLETVKDENGNILNYYEYRYYELTNQLESTPLGNNSFNLKITGDDLTNSNFTYEWIFGDGTTASGTSSIVTHNYPVSSNLSYTAIVNIKSGGSTIKTLTVICQCLGPCYLNFTNSTGCNFAFTITGTGFDSSKYTYEWNFGDGNTITNGISSIYHVYSYNGIYTVTVNIKYQNIVLKTMQTTVRCISGVNDGLQEI